MLDVVSCWVFRHLKAPFEICLATVGLSVGVSLIALVFS